MNIGSQPNRTNQVMQFLQAKRSIQTWVLILGIVLACAVGDTVGAAGKTTSPSTAATNSGQSSNHAISSPTATHRPPTATPAPTLKTIASYSGSGQKNTPTFHINTDQWQIAWACQPGDIGGNFSVEVDQADGTYFDLAVNEICDSNKHDVTIERGSGDFFLKITADTPWQIQIQAVQ